MTHSLESKDALGSKVSVFVQTYAGRMSFTEQNVLLSYILY